MTVNITPRTRTIVLLQGEDEEQLHQLRETAGELRQKADSLRPKKGVPVAPRLMGEADEPTEADNAATAAEQAADDFATEAEANGVRVIMRSLGRKTWRELIDKHPPRADDPQDAITRYNISTAPEDIVPACLASPALADAERAAFLDSLSDAQFDYLALIADQLNRGLGADPTQRLLSVSSHTSNGTSSSLSEPA